MKYFQSFPTVKYDVLGDGVSSLMTDFTPNFKVRDANLIRNASYMNYLIGDGERPDITSNILYGTTSYHWTFFVINEHLRKGISEWPLSQYDLDNYVSSKYSKYACITFDPTQHDASLSYIPFTSNYIDSLYLAADTAEGVAYRKIAKYDTLSCQMTIHRSNPILTFVDDALRTLYDPTDVPISDFISYGSYRIVCFKYNTDGIIIGVNDDFNNYVSSAYGLTVEQTLELHYNSAVDSLGNNLNYELIKNATYQFYTYINEEPTSISTYDVVAQNMIFPNVNRITYEEMEEIVNNKKRQIVVINPANISKFTESYFTALNNG